MRLLALLVLAASVVVLLPGAGRPAAARGDTTPSTGGVTTSGHTVVTAVPDRATITASVHTQAATAAEALAENARRASAVVAALRAAGGTDLQTQQISLSPLTKADGRIVGYAADDTVSAASPVQGAGALVDAAVAAGANTISGPSLEVAETDALYREALAKAVADARTKAQALAAAGGFAVGAVTSVVEGSNAPEPMAVAAAPARAASTPVEPGTQDVTADVTVTFGIR